MFSMIHSSAADVVLVPAFKYSIQRLTISSSFSWRLRRKSRYKMKLGSFMCLQAQNRGCKRWSTRLEMSKIFFHLFTKITITIFGKRLSTASLDAIETSPHRNLLISLTTWSLSLFPKHRTICDLKMANVKHSLGASMPSAASALALCSWTSVSKAQRWAYVYELRHEGLKRSTAKLRRRKHQRELLGAIIDVVAINSQGMASALKRWSMGKGCSIANESLLGYFTVHDEHGRAAEGDVEGDDGAERFTEEGMRYGRLPRVGRAGRLGGSKLVFFINFLMIGVMIRMMMMRKNHKVIAYLFLNFVFFSLLVIC